MLVPEERRVLGLISTRFLDDLASGDAEIVPLVVRPLEAGCLGSATHVDVPFSRW